MSHTSQTRLKLRAARPADRASAPPGATSPAAIAGTAKSTSGMGTTAYGPKNTASVPARMPTRTAVAYVQATRRRLGQAPEHHEADDREVGDPVGEPPDHGRLVRISTTLVDGDDRDGRHGERHDGHDHQVGPDGPEAMNSGGEEILDRRVPPDRRRRLCLRVRRRLCPLGHE